MNNGAIFTSIVFATFCVTLCSLFIVKGKAKTKLSSQFGFESANEWIMSSGLKLNIIQFAIYSFLLFVSTLFIAYSLSQTILISLVISFSVSLVPYFVISKKKSEKSKELLYSWPDVLRDISAHVSSGNSLSRALADVSLGESAVSNYFKRFSSLERTLGFQVTLEVIRKEMNDATSDRVIEVLVVANERGGRIVREILDELVSSIMQDIAVSESVQSESVEMKINSKAVVALPWCVLFVLTLSEGAFRNFYQSKDGAMVIGVGALLSAIGVFILSRLTRSEVEPRVFKETK